VTSVASSAKVIGPGFRELRGATKLTHKAVTAACGLCVAAVALAGPGVAATIPSSTVALKAAVADPATPAQATRNAWRGSPPFRQGQDNVGSLGYDGRGFGYNRFSGQVYQSCVEDLGYGRVRPCDSGGR
jgi:hypothetical protein